MKGIDVSVHNGAIDFKKVKEAGVEFVIIRAGYGFGNKDKNFETNYANAVSAGLHVGTYWYSYATDGSQALSEAKYFAEAIKGKKFDMPVYLDIEEARCQAKANDIIKQFCSYMESQNYFTGVYASKAFLNSYVNATNKNSYSIWVAQWASDCTYSGSYALWQYSDKGKVDGISGDVDLDKCYTDLPDIITRSGFNGYGKTSTEPTVPTGGTSLVQVLIDGKEVFSYEIKKE